MGIQRTFYSIWPFDIVIWRPSRWLMTQTCKMVELDLTCQSHGRDGTHALAFMLHETSEACDASRSSVLRGYGQTLVRRCAWQASTKKEQPSSSPHSRANKPWGDRRDGLCQNRRRGCSHNEYMFRLGTLHVVPCCGL